MILSRSELIAKMTARGVPTAAMNLFSPDEVAGAAFGTVSADFIRRAWVGFVDLLRSDPNARLTMPRALGNSGLSIEVPRYVDPGFVCRHVTFAFYGYLLLCCAKKAAAETLDHDGWAFAPIYYTATPRAENRNRSGRHCRIFFANPAGEIEEFEDGDGDPEPMIPEEFASVSFTLFT